jgi:uncharacterized protein YfaA (DUF2138 family)
MTNTDQNSSVHSNTSATTSGFKSIFLHRKKWVIAGFLIAIFVAAAFAFKVPHAKLDQKPINLNQPDVWVHSQNFSLLAHDLLQVPLLKSLLTEDFVYFYAQDEDWMSLQGAMRRISFEHDLNWPDSILKNIASAPTDLYMWHDDSHALRYWALSLERDQFTTVAQKLAMLKLTADKQLHEIAQINIDGDDVPILRVSLSAHRQMVLAAHGKRLVLLSDVSMASFEGGGLDDGAEQLIKNLLAKDAETRAKVVSEWSIQSKASPQQEFQQTIFLSNHFFAQGYGTYVPSVRALRFDYNGKNWLTEANLTPSNFDANIWTHLPANAAFCVSLPIDWAEAQKALDDADELNIKPNLASEFAASGAACWYAEENDDISQPLFVVLRKSEKDSTDILTALFDWGVATNQDHLKELFGLYRQKREIKDRLASAEFSLEALKKKKFSPKLKKEELVTKKAELEIEKKASQAQIKSIRAVLEAINPIIAKEKESTLAPAIIAKEKTISHEGNFTILARKLAIDSRSENSPQIAFDKKVVYFSTNQHLIARAIAVGGKHFPNMQESTKILNPSTQQFLYVNPKKLSVLINNTGHDALPQESQANLRAAFDYHMPARLSALAKHAPFSLVLDKPSVLSDLTNKEKSEWKPLTWQTAP